MNIRRIVIRIVGAIVLYTATFAFTCATVLESPAPEIVQLVATILLLSISSTIGGAILFVGPSPTERKKISSLCIFIGIIMIPITLTIPGIFLLDAKGWDNIFFAPLVVGLQFFFLGIIVRSAKASGQRIRDQDARAETPTTNKK